MNIQSKVFVTCLVFLLTACSGSDAPQPTPSDNTGDTETPPIAVEDNAMKETNNVSYTGTVQPAGISIYQQGSHRLVLPEGKFILLESDALDLNGYVDEKVEIFGALRPTVEAGGMIMRVERIKLLEIALESSSSVSDEESSKEASSQASSKSSIASSVQEETPSSSSTSSEPVPKVVTDSTPSPEYLDHLASMASQDFSAANWTTEYCTGHIGFCIPIHRNWYFRSYGTTSDAFWHVEVSSEPIENIGDGPIILELLEGASVAVDKKIQKAGATVVGYRTWSDNRHFEIRADSSLETAITYITEHLYEYLEE